MKQGTAKKAVTRITLQKQAILDVLQGGAKLMTAEEVYDNVREKQPNVSLGTVYRNLQGFSTQGSVNKTLLADGKARFELAGNIHHHHLICLSCGATAEVPWCPIGPEVSAFMDSRDFSPESHQFEIYGKCSQCRDRQ